MFQRMVNAIIYTKIDGAMSLRVTSVIEEIYSKKKKVQKSRRIQFLYVFFFFFVKIQNFKRNECNFSKSDIITILVSIERKIKHIP